MARKENKYHFIYKTTNLLSGRYYIGMHSTNDLEDGYLGSGNRLRRAIKKHGKENFIREILEFCESREELKLKEREVVNLEEISKKECMNLVVGGQGGLSGLPDETLKKIRNGSSKYQKEKWKDEEYRKKMSELLKEYVTENHKQGKMKYDNFTGNKHSEETKKKMSESSKGMGVGTTNSQYGTRWITNDIENKKIKKYEPTPEGWRDGRVIKKYIA